MKFVVRIYYLNGVNQQSFFKDEVFNIPVTKEGNDYPVLGTDEYQKLLDKADGYIRDSSTFLRNYMNYNDIDIIVDWKVLCLERDGLESYLNHQYQISYYKVLSILYLLCKDNNDVINLMSEFAVVYSHMYDVIKHLDVETQVNIIQKCLLLALDSNVELLNSLNHKTLKIN